MATTHCRWASAVIWANPGTVWSFSLFGLSRNIWARWNPEMERRDTSLRPLHTDSVGREQEIHHGWTALVEHHAWEPFPRPWWSREISHTALFHRKIGEQLNLMIRRHRAFIYCISSVNAFYNIFYAVRRYPGKIKERPSIGNDQRAFVLYSIRAVGTIWLIRAGFQGVGSVLPRKQTKHDCFRECVSANFQTLASCISWAYSQKGLLFPCCHNTKVISANSVSGPS